MDWFLLSCAVGDGCWWVGVVALSVDRLEEGGEVGIISLFLLHFCFLPLPLLHSSVVWTVKFTLALGPMARLPSFTD